MLTAKRVNQEPTIIFAHVFNVHSQSGVCHNDTGGNGVFIYERNKDFILKFELVSFRQRWIENARHYGDNIDGNFFLWLMSDFT